MSNIELRGSFYIRYREQSAHKIHPFYMICEFIDNAMGHTEKELTEIIIDISNDEITYIDNSLGLKSDNDSINDYLFSSNDPKFGTSRYHVGMKEAMFNFGPACKLSSKRKGDSAFTIIFDLNKPESEGIKKIDNWDLLDFEHGFKFTTKPIDEKKIEIDKQTPTSVTEFDNLVTWISEKYQDQIRENSLNFIIRGKGSLESYEHKINNKTLKWYLPLNENFCWTNAHKNISNDDWKLLLDHTISSNEKRNLDDYTGVKSNPKYCGVELISVKDVYEMFLHRKELSFTLKPTEIEIDDSENMLDFKTPVKFGFYLNTPNYDFHKLYKDDNDIELNHKTLFSYKNIKGAIVMQDKRGVAIGTNKIDVLKGIRTESEVRIWFNIEFDTKVKIDQNKIGFSTNTANIYKKVFQIDKKNKSENYTTKLRLSDWSQILVDLESEVKKYNASNLSMKEYIDLEEKNQKKNKKKKKEKIDYVAEGAKKKYNTIIQNIVEVDDKTREVEIEDHHGEVIKVVIKTGGVYDMGEKLFTEQKNNVDGENIYTFTVNASKQIFRIDDSGNKIENSLEQAKGFALSYALLKIELSKNEHESEVSKKANQLIKDAFDRIFK